MVNYINCILLQKLVYLIYHYSKSDASFIRTTGNIQFKYNSLYRNVMQSVYPTYVRLHKRAHFTAEVVRLEFTICDIQSEFINVLEDLAKLTQCGDSSRNFNVTLT